MQHVQHINNAYINVISFSLSLFYSPSGVNVMSVVRAGPYPTLVVALMLHVMMDPAANPQMRVDCKSVEIQSESSVRELLHLY